jgi:hypothetical protein
MAHVEVWWRHDDGNNGGHDDNNNDDNDERSKYAKYDYAHNRSPSLSCCSGVPSVNTCSLKHWKSIRFTARVTNTSFTRVTF